MNSMKSGIGCGAALVVVILGVFLFGYLVPQAINTARENYAAVVEAQAQLAVYEGVRGVLDASADAVRADTKAAHGAERYLFTLSVILPFAAINIAVLLFGKREADGLRAELEKLRGGGE